LVDHRTEIEAGILEIVSVEGPVLAQRAYQLYVVASRAQRVGTEIRRVLNQTVHRQIRAGQLANVHDDAAGMIDRTLYLPGREPVIIRELGERELLHVPKSEIQSLIELLGLANEHGEGVSRAVLEVYGLSRLGSRARDFLDACQTYRWTT
jgi:hypothetical protein